MSGLRFGTELGCGRSVAILLLLVVVEVRG